MAVGDLFVADPRAVPASVDRACDAIAEVEKGGAVDPVLAELGTQLADVAFRNAASNVAERIGAVKIRKDNQATIQLLEELVNELVSDKAELTRIAQAYQQEVQATQISADDIKYIAENLRPLLEKLAELSPGAGSAEGFLDVLEPLLSAETLTIAQLIGFNVRQAIGEPLTEVVRTQISDRLGSGKAPHSKGAPRQGTRR